VASGRNIDLVQQAIRDHGLPAPDFMICSVGSQIFLGEDPLAIDKSWSSYLDKNWRRDAIQRRLRTIKWLESQEPEAQNPHKISYYADPDAYDETQLNRVLGDYTKHVSIIHSHGKFLDVLPRRASKGKALRYICKKWHIGLDHVIAAGDSGNDLDMLLGSIKGILVGNRSSEMAEIRAGRNLYLAEAYAAEGICEGFEHFGIDLLS
jgi:sucrose-phosphate synthase